ncbi:MAG: YchJ family metal-binding protein [Gammaproteobacteria bacterium]|nr:YchJ family metal-binding protein [Gammaproteobacteria bacterium]
MTLCPCGLPQTYESCCSRFISHNDIPTTPEALMRSRYTAYFYGDMDYIAETMKSPAADKFNIEDAKRRAKKIKWVELNVVHSTHSIFNGTVEFYASYTDGKKIIALHEISDFICEDGKWFYVSGVFLD